MKDEGKGKGLSIHAELFLQLGLSERFCSRAVFRLWRLILYSFIIYNIHIIFRQAEDKTAPRYDIL